METKGTNRATRGEVADSPRGEFTFRRSDPQVETFISIREAQGGRKGLPQVDSLTLHQAKQLPEYQALIVSLKEQAYLILKVLIPE